MILNVNYSSISRPKGKGINDAFLQKDRKLQIKRHKRKQTMLNKFYLQHINTHLAITSVHPFLLLTACR